MFYHTTHIYNKKHVIVLFIYINWEKMDQFLRKTPQSSFSPVISSLLNFQVTLERR